MVRQLPDPDSEPKSNPEMLHPPVNESMAGEASSFGDSFVMEEELNDTETGVGTRMERNPLGKYLALQTTARSD